VNNFFLKKGDVMIKIIIATVVITALVPQAFAAGAASKKPSQHKKEAPLMLPASETKGSSETEISREILKKFYEAVARKDIEGARQYVHDGLIFYGVFETYHGPNEYLTSLTGLLGITTKLEVKTIIADGNNVAVFFDLETKSPAKGNVLVAEWHQIKDGKIYRVRSAFDARPFAKMFSGGKK
jgi:hypothetical protein